MRQLHFLLFTFFQYSWLSRNIVFKFKIVFSLYKTKLKKEQNNRNFCSSIMERLSLTTDFFLLWLLKDLEKTIRLGSSRPRQLKGGVGSLSLSLSLFRLSIFLSTFSSLTFAAVSFFFFFTFFKAAFSTMGSKCSRQLKLLETRGSNEKRKRKALICKLYVCTPLWVYYADNKSV